MVNKKTRFHYCCNLFWVYHYIDWTTVCACVYVMCGAEWIYTRPRNSSEQLITNDRYEKRAGKRRCRQYIHDWTGAVVMELRQLFDIDTIDSDTQQRIHGEQCFQLGKADLQSLDFSFNRLCMKLCKTGASMQLKTVSVALLQTCRAVFVKKAR